MKKNITTLLLPIMFSIGIAKSDILPLEKQVKQMDLFLQTVGLGINSGAIKVKDKDSARNNILTIRKSFLEASSDPGFDINIFINYLEKIVANNFNDLEEHNQLSFQRLNKDFGQDKNISQIEDKVFRDKLDNLNEQMKNSSYSDSQKIFRKLDQLDQAYNISKSVLRISPYVAFGLYSILITKKDILPKWKWLWAIKDLVGETSKEVTTTVAKSNGEADIVDPEVGLSEQDLRKDIRRIANQTAGTISKQTFEPGTGLGSILGKLSKFISIKNETLLSIAPTALMLPVLKRDFEDLTKFINTKKSKIRSYFMGENYKAPGKFKTSSLKFKDIPGFNENKAALNSIVNYFNNKKIFDLSGLILDRGYLLIGNQETGSLLATALAGEIKDCKIKEIHSSALVTDLEQLVKDTDEKTQSIILIKEIDWLSSQSLKPKDWNIISTELDKCLTGSKQILVFATASSLDKVDKLFTSYNKLGNIIEIETLDIEAMRDFIKKELSNMALDINNFNIDSIAQEAFKIPNVSYKQIVSLIKKAVINAHSLDQPLTEDNIKLVL